MANWEKLCPLSEIPPSGRKSFALGMWSVIVFNAGKRFYACAAECPHLGVNLESGELQGHVLRCSGHGYQLDLSNGQCLTEAGLELPIFQVESRPDGWIWIKI